MKKKFRTFFVASLLTASALTAGVASAAEPLRIGVSFQEMNNPYFVTMKDALQEAANTIGAKLIISDAHHDVSKQVNDIEDMVQQGVQLVIINPTDSAGVASIVKTVHDKKIPIVSVDAQASGPIDAFVGSKNYDAGFKACTYLGQTIKSGNVGIIDGIPVVPILERVKGCRAALGKFSGIKIVSVQNGKQERDQALTVAENMLQANPDLKGIFSVNDNGSLGVLSAIESSGQDIKLVSVDGAPEAVKAIAKPGSKFIGTAAQFPRQQIRLALAMALSKFWGATPPATVPVDVQLVDANGAKTFSW
ncbi:substrate-binding domain-containing protein [Kozakia baliensis]|uniref:LacI family transcriptional regulator n=1 Tax=Kozakia baliensis TaxID=153496 RepID=A0A1D8UX12_9PROT|nr:substrate-binding domain-containing protein [Kozakia baliensis]AOX18037.1 LacI family transcriptional regulator [Kozakia baliensis]GBR23751.1 sugar ABC transporter substrate-binding periplasmic protein [Kozakia baliensis NRIC 0488]GEL65309.1 LacI family transcriptional regulator [Kozakia baliensis]